MAYSVSKKGLIHYPPSSLKNFFRYGYEYIDCLHFLQNPKEYLSQPELLDEYLKEASALLEKGGWLGDGEIQLLWLPPFVFPFDIKASSNGVIIWFVKQDSDGISFLLSPVQLRFEEFEQ